jgi:hypothetical protein
MIFSQAFSQDSDKNDGYYEEKTADTTVNPYPKRLGIGPFVGFNTIVQSFYYDHIYGTGQPRGNVTYEGVFLEGAALSYVPLDFLMCEVTYLYSKNTKVTVADPNLGPNINQVVEISTQWIANPYARINFYATGGLSFILNELNKGRDKIDFSYNTIGFNVGVGFKINIPVKSAGMFNLYAEWRINWDVGQAAYTDYEKDKTGNYVVKATGTTNSYLSMPRFGILFYPGFIK